MKNLDSIISLRQPKLFISMHAEEKLVKEFHINCEAFPGIVFKVRAETLEKAVRKLMSEFRAAIAELQKNKGQTNHNQQTA